MMILTLSSKDFVEFLMNKRDYKSKHISEQFSLTITESLCFLKQNIEFRFTLLNIFVCEIIWEVQPDLNTGLIILLCRQGIAQSEHWAGSAPKCFL